MNRRDRSMNLRPAPTLLLLTAMWAALGLAASFLPQLLSLWQAGGILLVLVALFDARAVRALPDPQAEREVPASLALGVWREVQLSLSNPAVQTYCLEVFDGYPVSAELEHLPQRVEIPPQRRVRVRYRIRPRQRGLHHFDSVQVRVHSLLWQHLRRIPLDTEVRVYPNFAEVTKYTLLAIENRLGQLGIRKLQRRGDGLEFHQLREYRRGDSLRQIDWNATARQKKLISKEYQDERDQQVVFLIDGGRRMSAQDGALSHFDHTLNALLLLGYVAVRQGDALGLLTFGGTRRWLAPRKGAAVIKMVLNTLYDLQPSLHTSDYLRCAEDFLRHQQRRALVILVTNLRDEDHDELLPALKLLRKKHLVLLASLQERVLNEAQARLPRHFDEALRYAATQDYLLRRRQTHLALQAHGVLYLDTEPEQLPVHLVNRYLDIKRSGRL